jgi:glycosyltransferase involved in cell wall biosynthesis
MRASGEDFRLMTRHMKILHLFSNRKLTGPADPALSLCAELKRQGADIFFACCSPSSKKMAAVKGRAEELGLEPITSFQLKKHFDLKANVQDLRAIPRFLREHEIDIVHTHLDNDHLIGAHAARRARTGAVLLRSCYQGRGPRRTLRSRHVFGRYTDGVIVPSEIARTAMLEKFKFAPERVWLVGGSIDTDRFDPAKVRRDMRPDFSLDLGDFVVGIVARIQSHRRFDVLLEAMKIVSRRNPSIKLLIIGRGTKKEQLVVEPVRRMKLSKSVKFAGYRAGNEYVDTLACIDAKVFLVPGTDGTCRAVREAMAMGKPIIAARRGMLPEIVDHGVNGLIVTDTPAKLAEAICHLAQDGGLLKAMSDEAFRKTRMEFGVDKQAEAISNIYEELLGEVHRNRKI